MGRLCHPFLSVAYDREIVNQPISQIGLTPRRPYGANPVPQFVSIIHSPRFRHVMHRTEVKGAQEQIHRHWNSIQSVVIIIRILKCPSTQSMSTRLLISLNESQRPATVLPTPLHVQLPPQALHLPLEGPYSLGSMQVQSRIHILIPISQS